MDAQERPLLEWEGEQGPLVRRTKATLLDVDGTYHHVYNFFFRQRKTPLHFCRGVILNRCLAITVTVLLSGLLTGLHLLRKRHAMERSQYHTVIVII